MSGSLTNMVSSNGIGVVPDTLLNAFVQTDPTAAVLRGFVGLTNMTVTLLGITAPGDGLGGIFYWSNGNFTDDDLNTIVPPAAAGQGGWLRTGSAYVLPPSATFTNLTVTGAISGTAFSDYLASPPAIGGSSPAAGSFSTLSVATSLSGAGITNLFASPPAIGGTAAAAGAFTTLSATSTISGAGFTAWLASPPAIGGTAPAAGTFTTLRANTSLTLAGATSGTVVVTAPAIAGSTTLILTHQGNSQAQPSNPTAPASTSTYFMQGLAGTITPKTSGTVLLMISGTVTDATVTAGDGISYQLSYGTGAAPANAAALTGTQVGTIQTYKNPATVIAADVSVPFSTHAVVTGLTVGTAYWIDLAAKSVGTNSSGALAGVSISAVELL